MTKLMEAEELFHNRGANATWDGSDVDFAQSNAKIFHLGYLLLLDAIDAEDSEYGTVGAALSQST